MFLTHENQTSPSRATKELEVIGNSFLNQFLSAGASVRCIAAMRPELELKPTCKDNSTDAIDLKRHFATVNCGIAKGSFNHVVGEGKHVESHLDAERWRRVQVDDEREFGPSGNLGRRTFNRHRYF
jgi:hypothetical protein